MAAAMAACRRKLAVFLTPLSLPQPFITRATTKAFPPSRDVFPAYIIKFGTAGFVTLNSLASEGGDSSTSAEIMSVVEATSCCT